MPIIVSFDSINLPSTSYLWVCLDIAVPGENSRASSAAISAFCSSVSDAISSIEHEPDAHEPNGTTSPAYCVSSSGLPRASRVISTRLTSDPAVLKTFTSTASLRSSRSEERRVGKGCYSRRLRDTTNEKQH